MMKIVDLLGLELGHRQYRALPEMDPLTEDDALQDAQVLDVRFDALAGIGAILFELRMALQLQKANTGVLITHGVRELSWAGPAKGAPLTAWSVGSSVPSTVDHLFRLSLVMWPHPGARLMLTAESAAFFIGNVPGLSEAPPDYTQSDRQGLDSQVPDWNSPFEPVGAVFLDATQAE